MSDISDKTISICEASPTDGACAKFQSELIQAYKEQKAINNRSQCVSNDTAIGAVAGTVIGSPTGLGALAGLGLGTAVGYIYGNFYHCDKKQSSDLNF